MVGHGWLVEWVVRKTPTKTAVHFIGNPQNHNCKPVDILLIRPWVQHEWTNQLWVPISHYNGLIFFPFKQTTFSHLVIWKNPWFSHEQDGSHEPECIHVLGLWVQTSAIGKRTFFSTHRALISSQRGEDTWATIHTETANQHNNITTSTTKSQRNHQRNEITSATKSPAHCALHTPHSSLHKHYTLHTTLHTPHSTLSMVSVVSKQSPSFQRFDFPVTLFNYFSRMIWDEEKTSILL